ncbi:pseudouridine synthase [Geomonas sp.]|uniref:pseudouridine synthase n=1 Tax=Geomonas sp. TaxID=2651584 RepID=UPI002B4A1A47|nr:pseudouridine synthase [Geomonas sp.]HJV34838.1 pseudouridine synthase [Geomonas sp.]
MHLSKVTLPAVDPPFPSILAFLIAKFPHVSPEVWEKRLSEGKIVDESGNVVTINTTYRVGLKIFYQREVEQERVIPFAESILFHNDHLLVACKPHFLPVNPTGPFVAECLMNRLRKKTGNHDLVPINRIDRETAGLVLFSADRNTRDNYYRLFRDGEVEKCYEAVALVDKQPVQREWRVENRLVQGEPWFRMRVVDGEANARSVIRMAEVGEGRGLFQLQPLTGKTHQLRVHMNCVGFPILNDRYYPELQPESEDDFANPLQLLAKKVKFRDPVSGELMEFRSEWKLNWPT